MIVSSFGGSAFHFLRIRGNGNVDAMRLKDGRVFPNVSSGRFHSTTPNEMIKVIDELKKKRAYAKRLIQKGGLIKTGVARVSGQLQTVWQCFECGTEYIEIDGKIKCNGYAIGKCPWCRKDSKPGRYGRGI